MIGSKQAAQQRAERVTPNAGRQPPTARGSSITDKQNIDTPLALAYNRDPPP